MVSPKYLFSDYDYSRMNNIVVGDCLSERGVGFSGLCQKFRLSNDIFDVSLVVLSPPKFEQIVNNKN